MGTWGSGSLGWRLGCGEYGVLAGACASSACSASASPLGSATYTVEVSDVPMYRGRFVDMPLIWSAGTTAATPIWPFDAYRPWLCGIVLLDCVLSRCTDANEQWSLPWWYHLSSRMLEDRSSDIAYRVLLPFLPWVVSVSCIFLRHSRSSLLRHVMAVFQSPGAGLY
jgi:hypothetical protein